MSDDQLFLNGIDVETGEYLTEPMSLEAAAALAMGGEAPSKYKVDSAAQTLPFGVNEDDVANAGWAIVFASSVGKDVREALQPLIDHRQNSVKGDCCKVLEYGPGESVSDFLKRHDVYMGNVLPSKLPYYLLLVGHPHEIPFEFQYHLDVEYAVGRLALDTADEYRQYADSVVRCETEGCKRKKEVVYWGPRHDRATYLSSDKMLSPMFSESPSMAEGSPPLAEMFGYDARYIAADDATKANVADALHRSDSPAVLVTASHGVGWRRIHERQFLEQGALLCADWHGGGLRAEHYFRGEDLQSDAQVHGLVHFLFACYGAGTPKYDHFLKDRDAEPLQIAEQSFIAALPKRLLSHPNGGALAVLGHVDRAWGYSIEPKGAGAQLRPFEEFLGYTMMGKPLGFALKALNEKYASLSTQLASMLDHAAGNQPKSPEELVSAWIERNDAQNYILLGDPAAVQRVES